MSKKCLLVIVISFVFLLPFSAESANVFAPPIPARIGGSVTVDGTPLTQATDDGYTFTVAKQDGTAYVDLNGVPAQDLDGLNTSDWYLIDIPTYDAADQTGGANPGDTAVLHVFKDGSELTVTSPANGEFTVGDGGTNTQIDLVANTNQKPVANAGTDDTVIESAFVTLDGSGSSDSDGTVEAYSWTQTGGTYVVLSNTAAQKPTFTAPSVGAGGDALTFQLIVTDNDGAVSDPDEVTIIVSNVNQAPVTSAGTDQTVDEGDPVTLDGSGSNDPDGTVEAYSWAQTDGTPVTLSDPTSQKPTFTAPDVGPNGETLTFQLTVTDNEGLSSSPDTVKIYVMWVPPSFDATGDWTVSTSNSWAAGGCSPMEEDTSTVTVTQTGDDITIVDDEGETFTGKVDGETYTFSGTFVTDDNFTVIMNGTFTLTSETSGAGNVIWSANDGVTFCNGGFDLDLAKQSQVQPPGGGGGGGGGGCFIATGVNGACMTN